MHHLLIKIDDMDAAFGNSADLNAMQADYFRGVLRSLRKDLAGILPHTEAQRQATQQGETRYLPTRPQAADTATS